jgi:gliding motility-associated-like protein
LAFSTTTTVEILPAPIPTFTQVAPICPGDMLADLPTISNNNITGTWSPAMNNTATTTYTFTPTTGICARTTTMTIAVGTTTPDFTQVAPICPNAPLANLPTTSINGVPGTWSPPLDNTTTTTYTFTPAPEICASVVTMTIQVLPLTIVPTFANIAPICPNGVLAALPTTSNNGITGIWSPALDNTTTTTYTFTPDPAQCALTTTLTIIVNPELVVTVNSPSFCPGSTATVIATPAIPGTYTYAWTVPAGFPDPGNVASFTTSTVGDYSVVITQVSSFCNTDFESPVATGVSPNLFNENLVPCWDTTSSDGIIEIWPPGFENTFAYSGNQLIELNGNFPGALFQDFNVIPGTSISVSFAHRGRQGNDMVGVEIGPLGGPYVSLGNFTDGNTAWVLHSLNYTIPTGAGNNYTLRFVSVSAAGGSPSIGNLLDAISISSLSCPSQPATGNVSLQTLSGPTVTVTQPTCTVQSGTIEVTSPIGSVTDYEYSLDSGTYQPGATFTNVSPGVTHTITVHDLNTGCFSLPFDVIIDPVPQFASVTTISYATPVCQNATTNPVPDTSAAGFTSGGVFSSTTGLAIDPTTGVINLANTTAGTYLVTYAVANNTTTCQLAGSSTFTIVINPIITPVTGFSYTSPICKNGTNPIPIPVSGFTTGGSYTSTTGLSINSTTGVIDLANSAAGAYTVTYTVAANVATCQVGNNSTASITINPVITPVTTISYPSPVCAGDTNPLPNTSTTGFTIGGTYSSTTGLSLNALTGEINLSTTTPGTYTVTYTVGANVPTCQIEGSSTTQIVIVAPIEISVEGGCQSANYVLTALPINNSFNPETVSYIWQNASGQTVGTNSQSTTVTEIGIYTVTITSNGCDTESLPVNVDTIACVIQKGISVNNDGKNDSFDLTGFNVKNLSIFNRYGEKVYTFKNYTNQWAGQSDNGEELPDGTYYYVINRDNGETKTGWVYINRAQ